ncbi:hypothetical protein NKJ88_32655, partial [Mesorhizobium sp. M0016]|uniref:hypothetical protein n=1 Tax=Mesorhizobium sp. M0016 TaxID=2956843 RepID=UPI00333C307F
SGFESKMSLTAALVDLPSVLVMVAFLPGIGDVEHHQPAMTALSQRICRTLSTLPVIDRLPAGLWST